MVKPTCFGGKKDSPFLRAAAVCWWWWIGKDQNTPCSLCLQQQFWARCCSCKYSEYRTFRFWCHKHTHLGYFPVHQQQPWDKVSLFPPRNMLACYFAYFDHLSLLSINDLKFTSRLAFHRRWGAPSFSTSNSKIQWNTKLLKSHEKMFLHWTATSSLVIWVTQHFPGSRWKDGDVNPPAELKLWVRLAYELTFLPTLFAYFSYCSAAL